MLEPLLRNWPLKLLALGLAVAIWGSVTGEKRIVLDLSVPLDIELRRDRVLTHPAPKTVSVRLSGPQSALRRLDPLDLALKLDLTETLLGEREVQLGRADLVGVPNRVDVDSFDPDRVRLAVDRRMTRELPVSVDLVGEPPVGYHVYQASVEPKTIQVEGPASVIGEMTVVPTDPILVDNRSRSFSERVGAVPQRTEVRVIDPRPFDVRVVVDQEPVRKTFEVPVVPEPARPVVEVSPRAVKVTLSGPPIVLEAVTATEVRCRVDSSGLGDGHASRRRTVQVELVDLPPDHLERLKIEEIRPAEVGLRVDATSEEG